MHGMRAGIFQELNPFLLCNALLVQCMLWRCLSVCPSITSRCSIKMVRQSTYHANSDPR